MTLCLFVLIITCVFYVSWRLLTTTFSAPPGPFQWPVLGNMLLLMRHKGNTFSFLRKMREKYGNVFSLRIGSLDVVVISELKLLKTAFIHKSETFSERPTTSLYTLNVLQKLVGTGIVLSNGDQWLSTKRKALSSLRATRHGGQAVEDAVTQEVEVLLGHVTASCGQPFKMGSLLHQATANIVSSLVLNKRFAHDDPTFLQLLKKLEMSLQADLTNSAANFFPFLRIFPFFLKDIHKFVSTFKYTAQYIRQLSSSEKDTSLTSGSQCLFDLIVNAQKQEDTEQADIYLHAVVDMFSAGTNTVATSLSWALLLLAAHPSVQWRCQLEIDQVTEGRSVKLSDKSKLPFTEATMLEVLRVRCVAPTGIPHSTSRQTELDGYTIPSNAIVIANLYAINHDSRTWPDPYRFEPEHFLDVDGNLINRDRLVTFSVGPRSCLGESLAKSEFFLIMASLLQRFHIRPVPGTAVDLTPVEGATLLFPVPQDLVFRPRA